jgi:hypothetical protein
LILDANPAAVNLLLQMAWPYFEPAELRLPFLCAGDIITSLKRKSPHAFTHPQQPPPAFGTVASLGALVGT